MRFLCNAPAHAQQMVIDSFAPNRQDSDYSALVAKLIEWDLPTDVSNIRGIRVYGMVLIHIYVY